MGTTGGFKDHFSTGSAEYSAYRPTYPEALGAYLAGIAPDTAVALDCGCGTGQLSLRLASHFARVVATDASAEQIAHAQAHPRIDYRCAPAQASGLAEHSVSLVTVAQAAHWFDLEAFYAEVRRICRPGGILALITYGIIEADGEVGGCITHFYQEVAGPHWPPERRHVETGYRALPFPFPERQAPPLSMRTSWTLDQLLGYVDTWSAVRSLERAGRRADYEAFAQALGAVWGDGQTRREIRWPLSLRVGEV